MDSLNIIDVEENISTEVSKIDFLEKKVELLELKIDRLESIIDNLSIKPQNIRDKPTTDKTIEVLAEMKIYKKSLVLISDSKETGTYQIKDTLKSHGAKWFSKILNDKLKLNGWILPGILTDRAPEIAAKELIEKLKEQNINLVAEITGSVE